MTPKPKSRSMQKVWATQKSAVSWAVLVIKWYETFAWGLIGSM